MATMNTPASVLANSYGSQLYLDPSNSVAPVEQYITQDMFISCQSWSSIAAATITITARLLLPDGTLKLTQATLTTAAARGKASAVVALTEGFLLSVVALGGATNTQDRTYLSMRLQKGSFQNSQTVQQLGAGYVNATRYLTWPGGVHQSGSETAGVPISVTGTTPGPGSEISETVPANARWELVSFTFSLASSAAAGNRSPALIIDDGTNAFFQSTQVSTQAASLTYGYTYFQGASQIAGQTGQLNGAIPVGIQLTPGFRIRTNTVNLQGGDQYTAPQYLVKEWIMP